MKHVLITGGAGFLGSHLCEMFLNKNYRVTAIDHFLTGRPQNLISFRNHPHFHFVEHDVSKPIPKEKFAFLKYGIDGVLHFACPASPVDFQKIPLDILTSDSLGTMNTVNLALEFRSRYLLASTSEVYGDPLIHPQPENYFGNVNTVGPRACYDETKRFAEAYVGQAIRSLGLNAGIARIFNAYGPRMRPDDGRAIPEFISQGLRGGQIPIYGDGLQTRSFCYITDMIDGILKLFESDLKEPVNLGNPDERSIVELAEIIVKMTGSYSRIRYFSARQDDPKRRCPVIRKAETLLNWRPQVSLQEGLTHTLRYFDSSKYLPLGRNTKGDQDTFPSFITHRTA